MDAINVPVELTVDHEDGVEIGGRLFKGKTSGADTGITVTRDGDNAVIHLLLHNATATVPAKGLRSIKAKVSKQGIVYETDHDEAFRPSSNWCCSPVTPYECGSQQKCGWGQQCITCNGVNYCSQGCN